MSRGRDSFDPFLALPFLPPTSNNHHKGSQRLTSEVYGHTRYFARSGGHLLQDHSDRMVGMTPKRALSLAVVSCEAGYYLKLPPTIGRSLRLSITSSLALSPPRLSCAASKTTDDERDTGSVGTGLAFEPRFSPCSCRSRRYERTIRRLDERGPGCEMGNRCMIDDRIRTHSACLLTLATVGILRDIDVRPFASHQVPATSRARIRYRHSRSSLRYRGLI